MRVLLHICCAPCAVYPHRELSEEGHEVFGFWYNPNIHPYLEYQKRLDTVKLFAERVGLRMIYKDKYDLEGFLRFMVFREDNRCRFCYAMRLTEAARVARNGGFDCFTTTLLQSSHQQQEVIREVGELMAREYGVSFLFRDWREGWREGLQASKDWGLYRQQYCGCIYSERDRYLGPKGQREQHRDI